MKHPFLHLGLAIGLALSFSASLRGQQLREGIWSGTWVNSGGDNPRPRGVSIEVKKTTDPHWRWLPNRGELWNATLVTPQGRQQLSDVRLEGGTLSYSFRQEDTKVNCRLEIRQDGAYEGDCVGEGGRPRRHITLTPPEASVER